MSSSLRILNAYSINLTWEVFQLHKMTPSFTVNAILMSIDFPADNTLHPTELSANDKTIMINYYPRTVSNSATQEETLINTHTAKLE